MSNNLRQIAKDLRSFVKRCKDVHYSDSLLITFLVTGLLTLAPKTLSADVVEEQQEISASAYDTITDLRQSFIRARQENEKSIKGAERELILLMEQGDQVIKSPWASFQFATGFTNNDWRTSYRGRGGKYLEYYNRTNDLTKYVFDASKHEYGATNLHVQRNQEPNSLTINPANIHEPYKPYEAYKIDNINMPKDVSFNPNVPTSTPWQKPANYVQNGTSTSYTLNNANPNNNYGSYWGNDATFNYSSTKLRSFDGWRNRTVNSESQNLTVAGPLGGSSATNRGEMYNGTQTSSSATVNELYRSNYWWNPGSSSWTSNVWYYNLQGGVTPDNTALTSAKVLTNQYYTPGDSGAWSNTLAGYDQVSVSRNWWWWWGWAPGYSWGTTQSWWENTLYDRYGAHPNDNGNLAGGRTYNSLSTDYDTANNGITTYVDGGGTRHWVSYNGTDNTTSRDQALTDGLSHMHPGVSGYGSSPTKSDFLHKALFIYAGSPVYNSGYGNWYNDALETGSETQGLNRKQMVLTDKAITTQFLDVHIGQNADKRGGTFAKVLDKGTVTADDVDVSIYNGAGGAYVMSPGRTGTSKVVFSNNGNSIANFDTRNGVIDGGGLT